MFRIGTGPAGSGPRGGTAIVSGAVAVAGEVCLDGVPAGGISQKRLKVQAVCCLNL